MKKVIIIAGPNGAGKTTFARAFLPEEAKCQRNTIKTSLMIGGFTTILKTNPLYLNGVKNNDSTRIAQCKK